MIASAQLQSNSSLRAVGCAAQARWSTDFGHQMRRHFDAPGCEATLGRMQLTGYATDPRYVDDLMGITARPSVKGAKQAFRP